MNNVLIYVEDEPSSPYPKLRCIHCGADFDFAPGFTETTDEEISRLLQAVKDFVDTHDDCKRTDVLYFPAGIDPADFDQPESTP